MVVRYSFVLTGFCALLFPFDFANMIATLKAKQDAVKSMTAEIAVVISTSRGAIGQKGLFYFEAPNKSRLDFTAPIKQSMIFNGTVSYLKNVNEIKYRKLDMPNAVESFNDMFYSRYLEKMYFDVETETSSNVMFFGYRDERKIVKVFWGLFDKATGVIPQSKIFAGGKGGGMFAAATCRFTNIGGVTVADKVITDATTGGVGGRTVIEIRKIVLNAPITSSVWIAQ